MKSRRSLKHLLINPETQIRYGVVFLSCAMVVHATLTVLGISMYAAWATGAAEVSSVPLGMMIAGLVGIYLTIYGFAFVLGLVVSHRVYGPLVNIERFLQRLKEGDFSARIVLRKADDNKIKELADNLNQLAARLEQTKH